jgi:filamentous hemagglutinin family protein
MEALPWHILGESLSVDPGQSGMNAGRSAEVRRAVIPFSFGGCLASVFLALVPATAAGEVATDGTLGRRIRLAGPDVEVGAELGRISGRNLFHSFERFGVDAGGRVTFTGPDGLDNIVSRVTGGEASRIDGTLASRVPGADLYLVNPAGIIFGPGGRNP